MRIVEIATGDDQFSDLVTAVDRAGLVFVLEGNGPFTVFAPLNNAFAAIQSAVDGLDNGQLSKVLLYHVTNGNITSDKISDGAVIPTANGGITVTANIVGGTVTLKDVSGNTATVVLTDVQTTNGVLHVIDSVIIPDNL